MTTALGPGSLDFAALSGREEISRLFEFVLSLNGPDPELDPERLLGTSMTLEIALPSGRRRYLNGECVDFSNLGWRHGQAAYEARLRPWLWYADRQTRSRVFERQSVPDIVRQVLAAYPFPTRFLLSRRYAPRSYCAQYRESDAQFVMRLLESEGLWFWFEHLAGRHELMIVDDVALSGPGPGHRPIRYCGPGQRSAGQAEYLDSWKTGGTLSTTAAPIPDHAAPPCRRYADAVPGRPWNSACGGSASGCTAALAPGHLFALEGHPCATQNRRYLVLAADYRFSAVHGQARTLSTRIETHPGDRAFRPACRTPQPRVVGLQTATVIGNAVRFADGRDRLRVGFAWPGKDLENRHCGWVPLALAKRGQDDQGYPAVGEKVFIDHLDGDPDRPLITGRVGAPRQDASRATAMPPANRAPTALPPPTSLYPLLAAAAADPRLAQACSQSIRFLNEREIVLRCEGHCIRITPERIEVTASPLEERPWANAGLEPG
nr:type VI secretion system tip protein VgrG [Pseudomonas sp. RIT-PI-AD]